MSTASGVGDPASLEVVQAEPPLLCNHLLLDGHFHQPLPGCVEAATYAGRFRRRLRSAVAARPRLALTDPIAARCRCFPRAAKAWIPADSAILDERRVVKSPSRSVRSSSMCLSDNVNSISLAVPSRKSAFDVSAPLVMTYSSYCRPVPSISGRALLWSAISRISCNSSRPPMNSVSRAPFSVMIAVAGLIY